MNNTLILTDEGTHSAPKCWYVFRRPDGTSYARYRYGNSNLSEGEYTLAEAQKETAGQLRKV